MPIAHRLRMPCHRSSSPSNVRSALPQLTRRQFLCLFSNQNVFLPNLCRLLHRDCLMISIFAKHPNVVYKASLHDCIDHCDERQQLILKIKFFFQGWWQLAGPAATCRVENINEIIIVAPYINNLTNDIWFVRDCPPSVQEREIVFKVYRRAGGYN